MLQRLELDKKVYYDLKEHCLERGVGFLSTAFDSESLDFIVYELGVRTLKISSGEITNGPLLLEYARTGRDIVLSTGMSTLEEVEQALGVIAFGLLNPDNMGIQLSNDIFKKSLSSNDGRNILREKVTLLHCTTEYPAPFDEVNLNAMIHLRDYFGLNVGYSDHTSGTVASVAAATLGATIIEKHFTLDKMLDGPDHIASLDPRELKVMVDEVRTVERIMGTSTKGPTLSEIKNRSIVRKSLIASRDIAVGEHLSESNMVAKRPGDGISPMRYWDLIGKKINVNIQEGEIIAF